MKYLQGARNGTLVAGNGTGGVGLNQLAASGSRYLYVDSRENIYISDTYNGRISYWANGASSGVIVAGNGTYGTSLNQLAYPYGVWVDSSSNIYIAEYQVHRVTKWTPGATAGILIAGGNGAGNAPNKLASPAGIYFDEVNQDLYVSNSGSSAATVMRWRIGDNGTIIAGTGGSAGATATQLNSPMGITLDRWMNLYVADRTNNRIQLFCNGSMTGITIAGSGSGGSSISAPYDVKLDSQMNLYVSENSGSKISKFGKL